MHVFINKMKSDLCSIVCLHVAKMSINAHGHSTVWGAVVILVSLHVVKKPCIQNVYGFLILYYI